MTCCVHRTEDHITYPALRTRRMQTECTRCMCFTRHKQTAEEWRERSNR